MLLQFVPDVAVALELLLRRAQHLPDFARALFDGEGPEAHLQAGQKGREGGGADGVVQSVSRTPLPTDKSDLTLRGSEPLYRVLIKLDTEAITAYGVRNRLLPGMQVDADIVIARRSMIEWMLDPLYAAGIRR